MSARNYSSSTASKRRSREAPAPGSAAARAAGAAFDRDNRRDLRSRLAPSRSRQKQLKRWRRDWKRNLIERDNPEWNDLAGGLVLEPLAA
jgi:hypothetical protein